MGGKGEATDPALGFALRAVLWIGGLVALLRLPWVQERLLVPFAMVQQRAAEAISGIAGAVRVDASCTGSDAIALTLGALLAYPASWRNRWLGCLAGLGLLVAVNTVRIGTLGVVAGNRALFDLLHLYLWPAALMLVAAGFAFWWMSRQGRRVAPAADRGVRSIEPPAGAVRRMLLYSLPALGLYYLAAPLLHRSERVLELARWCAVAAAGVAGALAFEVEVSGNYFFTANGKWIVTQTCVLTPLIALYLAGVAAAPLNRGRRLLLAVAAAPLFFLLGVARLLVLTLPETLVPAPGTAMHAFYQLVAGAALIVISSQAVGHRGPRGGLAHGARALLAAALAAVAGAAVAALGVELAGRAATATPALAHLGHGYVDAQGALTILPAFQTALWAGLWWALRRPSGWRGLAAGWLALNVLAAVAAVALGELHRHLGLSVPVLWIRAWALLAPAALAWALHRRAERPELPLAAAASAS